MKRPRIPKLFTDTFGEWVKTGSHKNRWVRYGLKSDGNSWASRGKIVLVFVNNTDVYMGATRITKVGWVLSRMGMDIKWSKSFPSENADKAIAHYFASVICDE